MRKGFFTKLSLVVALLLLAVSFVLPTVLGLKDVPDEKRPWYTSMLPEKYLKLGLDLRGGIQMVLGVDVDKAIENEVVRYVDELKDFLKEEKVNFVDIFKPDKKNEIVIRLAAAADKEPLFTFFQTKFNILELSNQDDKTLEFGYTVIKERQREIERDTIRQALETIRNRIDEFGVSEPQISTQGRNRIVVQLPGMDDPSRARELLGKTAQLEFRMVDTGLSSDQLFRLVETAKRELKEQGKKEDDIDSGMVTRHLENQLPAGTIVMFGSEDQEDPNAAVTPYLLKKKVALTGEKLDDARVSTAGQFNQPAVAFTLNPAGARIFDKLSGENIGKQMAIILDERVASAPVFQSRIPNGKGQITMGGYRDRQTILKEARDLAIVLRAGALPAPVDILENRAVGPSLGNDSVQMGTLSLMIGGIIVIIFMLFIYRIPGIIADLVLIMNVLFMMAILAAFQATLTLPGIAGLVLTIGMAVDANIIIFERIREELGLGKSPVEAVGTGFNLAHLTILDANVTTLIAGFVLLQYGTGPVKGFAVTLIIGIITSYITALWIARFFFGMVLNNESTAQSLFKPKGS